MVPFSCEINAVDHCNITCIDCNHASPAIGRCFADPAVIERDCSTLARCYRAPLVKVLGGEPLLHPELPSVLQALRRSLIAPKILLVTNGTLPNRMTEAVWRSLDEVEISVYPDAGVDESLLRHYRMQARRYGKKLTAIEYLNFRRTFALNGTGNHALVRRIFATCKLANRWGCHSIHEGRVHKCLQSIYIPRIVGRPSELQGADGLPIEASASFAQALKEYLTSPEPLWSCRHCLGTVGVERGHGFVARREWLGAHEFQMESLVDFDKLSKCESGSEAADVAKAVL